MIKCTIKYQIPLKVSGISLAHPFHFIHADSSDYNLSICPSCSEVPRSFSSPKKLSLEKLPSSSGLGMISTVSSRDMPGGRSALFAPLLNKMPKACLSLPSALTDTIMRVFYGVCSSSTVCRLTTLDVIWSSVKPACLSSSTARSALICSLKTPTIVSLQTRVSFSGLAMIRIA